jgi:hypothetical protein
MSEFCAVLAMKGNCPSRIYKPYKDLGHRRNSISLSSRLDNSHTRSSSCSSKLITNTHKPPPKTQTHINNVVLSIPEGRDQADSGRMLVSRVFIRSSHHPHLLPWLTLPSCSCILDLDLVSFTTDAAPSAPPSPAPKPVRVLDNAPAQGARTGRPRR